MHAQIGRFNNEMEELAKTAKAIRETNAYCWQSLFNCQNRRAMGSHFHKLMITYQLVMGSTVLYNVEVNNVRLASLYGQYVMPPEVDMTNESASDSRKVLGRESSGIDKSKVSFFAAVYA